MDIAMTLPTMLPHTRREVLDWCREVDAGPWSSLAVPERTTYTSHDCIVQLAAAAALTQRVALWTTIVDAWQTAGRDRAPHLSTSIWYALGDDAEARLRGYAYDYLKIFGEDAGRYGANGVACFTEDALRRAVAEIRAAGADELFLVPTTVDPAELERTAAALARG